MKDHVRKSRSIDSHVRVIIALVFTIFAGALLWGKLRVPFLIIICWDVFTLVDLALAWTHVLYADPVESVRSATLEDSSRSVIFVSVVTAAFASLFAVGYLLSSGRGLPHGQLVGHVILTVVTVISSWCLIHTVFALRYAHIFYGQDEHVKTKGERSALVFPDEPNPDYFDFAYFSFVIGMTCQVSDVQICSRRLRRLALVHGLLTFLFNTVIVALSINIVSGLI